MLTKIVAQTRNIYTYDVVSTLTIDVTDQNSVYRLKDIDGLGPVKAEISSVDLAAEAGQAFLYARDSSRNITMTLEFNPDWKTDSDTTSLRRKLYEVFMPKTRVELALTDTEMGVMSIVTYVETHEPVIFSQKPSVQISMLAMEPYFRKPPEGTLTYQVPNSRISSFSVPFDGDVPVGFAMECTLTQARANVDFRFAKLGTKGEAVVNTSWEAGDIYRLQTVSGQKGVLRYRDGKGTSILGRFSGTFTPLKLTKGLNYFTFSHPTSVTNMKLMYIRLYGGM